MTERRMFIDLDREVTRRKRFHCLYGADEQPIFQARAFSDMLYALDDRDIEEIDLWDGQTMWRARIKRIDPTKEQE